MFFFSNIQIKMNKQKATFGKDISDVNNKQQIE